jgi:hypothetical protein
MSSENGHDHQHDTHYHGEPSRVLDDRPLPEAVVLYRRSDSTADSSDRLNTWLEQLSGVEEINRVYTDGSDVDAEEFNLTGVTLESSQINPLFNSFEGFANQILEEPSVLFIPLELSLGQDAWVDLKSNDVTVNWLTVDTNPTTDRELARVVVLSDWITTVGRDVPEGRSTGVSPGLFHITGEDLPDFGEICERESDLASVFETFLDDPSSKLRPAFLHEREWKLNKD